jgi:hypothetical protein
MTVESRIFSVAEYVQPSEGEPIRSVVLETRDSIIVVWHVHPGRKLRLTFILTAKTRGLFCREWLITFRAMGLFVPSGKVR